MYFLSGALLLICITFMGCSKTEEQEEEEFRRIVQVEEGSTEPLQ